MHKVPFASPARFLAVLAAFSLTAMAAHSQVPGPSVAPPGPAAAPAQIPVHDLPLANANDALLAKASALYYSNAKSGLAGFDCSIHPDWRALFNSVDKASTVAGDDPRVVLLNSVKITLHAHTTGDSTVDWTSPANPGASPDENSASLLEAMHQATEQTLQGFLQFWAPFVDGSAVPDSADGLEITPADKGGYKIHLDQDGTAVTEVLSSSLLLEQFNVGMSGMNVNFIPSYTPTDQGLLVNSFLAHILPSAAAAAPEQEMRVSIEYQTVDGFPIPAKLNMETVNTGIFNFVLDGCTVSRQPR
jgi:hypothetical protein